MDGKRLYKSMKRLVKSEKPIKKIGLTLSLQEKLDLMEQIRSDLKTENIEVPGIVVAGSQSSGKSSVLESLSGIKLPSGNTITTRVPLILRLEKKETQQPFAIIHDHPDLSYGEHIESVDDIPHKIEEYTNKIAGDNGAVYDKPIHLKFVQNDGPTMTIIDLPGITHMSVDNVQEDIHSQTVNLVKKYISNENMIILCVVPATEDFANSEAIKLSKEIDVYGKRTLGVITKIDTCPDDISDKIKGIGRNVQLELGFIPVKNRGPTEQNITLKELRKSEKHFFENSPFYKGIQDCNRGIPALIDKVVNLQAIKIDDFIPTVVEKLQTIVSQLHSELDSDEYNFKTKEDKYRYVNKSIMKLTDKVTVIKQEPSIFHHFKIYHDNIYKDIPDFFSDEYHNSLKKDVKLIQGIMLPNFLPPPILDHALLQLREKISEQTTLLIIKVFNDINSKMKDYVQNNISNEVSHFIINEVNMCLDNLRRITTQYVNTMLKAESQVYTQSNSYMNTIKDIREMAVNEESQDGIPIEYLTKYGSTSIGNDVHTICELQSSLYAYTHVYVNRICDTVPMILLQYISDFSSNVIQTLLEKVDESIIEKYMSDDNDLIEEKIQKENKLERLEFTLNKLRAM